MAGAGVELAETIAPNLIIASDAVEEFFVGQRVKSSIEGDAVDAGGQKVENLGCAEGLVALLEDSQDGNANGGAAEAGFAEELGGGFFKLSHDPIIYRVGAKREFPLGGQFEARNEFSIPHGGAVDVQGSN
jgi:hypothetical protein